MDLWRADASGAGPARGYNGTYTSYLWAKEAENVIMEGGDEPFFMYLALHNVHQPV